MIITGLPRQKLMMKININQIGSICFRGFGVSLHCNLGVGSPSLSLARACAYSWRLIDIIKIRARLIIENIIEE